MTITMGWVLFWPFFFCRRNGQGRTRCSTVVLLSQARPLCLGLSHLAHSPSMCRALIFVEHLNFKLSKDNVNMMCAPNDYMGPLVRVVGFNTTFVTVISTYLDARKLRWLARWLIGYVHALDNLATGSCGLPPVCASMAARRAGKRAASSRDVTEQPPQAQHCCT